MSRELTLHEKVKQQQSALSVDFPKFLQQRLGSIGRRGLRAPARPRYERSLRSAALDGKCSLPEVGGADRLSEKPSPALPDLVATSVATQVNWETSRYVRFGS
jgi:hypothetical protein